MAKLLIDIERTHRKDKPINIEVVKIGSGFEINEILMYAIRAYIEEEKEKGRSNWT